MATQSFRAGGEITIAKINKLTGALSTAFDFIGCATSFEPKLNIEEGSIVEGCSGLFQTVDTYDKTKGGTFDIGVYDITPKNLAIATGGSIQEAGDSASVVDETLPAGVTAGQRWQLGAGDPEGKTHENITALTGEDSATVPTALVLGTHYSLQAETGEVKFLDVSALTQPVKFSYTHQDKAYVSIFTDTQQEWFLRYNWRNAANSLERGGAEFYRAKFKSTLFPMISQDAVVLPLSGNLLADLNKPVDVVWGQFGRVIPDYDA